MEVLSYLLVDGDEDNAIWYGYLGYGLVDVPDVPVLVMVGMVCVEIDCGPSGSNLDRLSEMGRFIAGEVGNCD